MGQVKIPEPGEELRPPPTNLVQSPNDLLSLDPNTVQKHFHLFFLLHSCCMYTIFSWRTTGPIRRAKGGWTLEEDDTLKRAIELYKGKCWKKIAEFFPDRSEVQCLHRWQKVLNPELVKGLWTQEEDDTIIELVSKYGPPKWSVIAKSLPGRIGKQCCERWHNHLNPDIKKDAWTMEEELGLMNAQRIYGNRWAEIAKFLPGSISPQSTSLSLSISLSLSAQSFQRKRHDSGKRRGKGKSHIRSSLQSDLRFASCRRPQVRSKPDTEDAQNQIWIV